MNKTVRYELKRDGQWLPCRIICDSSAWGFMIVAYAWQGVEYQTRANALHIRVVA